MNNFDTPSPHRDEELANHEGQTKEAIKLSDPLPAEYQKVLDSISEEIPEAYKAQMMEAAYYFWALEEGKELLDGVGNSLTEKTELLANQLVRSNFISVPYFLGQRLGGVPPEECLPKWVIDRKRQEKEQNETLSREEVQRSNPEAVYDAYAKTTAIEIIKRPNGDYAYYDVGVMPKEQVRRITNHCKGYIEGSLRDMESVLAGLKDLAANNIHPDSSKLIESNRLVLYWDHPSDKVGSSVRKILTDHGVSLRGMAQDPMMLEVKEDGALEITKETVMASNDESLGQGGMGNPYLWHAIPYDAQKFFHQYLRLVTYGAKDPIEPYRIGYIRINTRGFTGTQKYLDELIDEVEKREGLPAIVSDSRIELDDQNIRDELRLQPKRN